MTSPELARHQPKELTAYRLQVPALLPRLSSLRKRRSIRPGEFQSLLWLFIGLCALIPGFYTGPLKLVFKLLETTLDGLFWANSVLRYYWVGILVPLAVVVGCGTAGGHSACTANAPHLSCYRVA